MVESLRGTQDDVVQHGACLGLGIACLGSEDAEVFEEIKNVLYIDNAVAGEAAGLALGLVFAGSGTQPGVGVPMVLISGRLAAERIVGPVK